MAFASPAAADWLGHELARDRGFSIHAFIGSLGGTRLLDTAIRSVPGWHQISVLLEMGAAGGRTGDLTRADAIVLAEQASRISGRNLGGVATDEGVATSRANCAQAPSVERGADHDAHIRCPEGSLLEFGGRVAPAGPRRRLRFDRWRGLFEMDDSDKVVDVIAAYF